MPAVLVDTGPLVALFDRSDPHHQRCAETFAAMDDSLVTVLPVISEAMHLLRFSLPAQDAVWELTSPILWESFPWMPTISRVFES